MKPHISQEVYFLKRLRLTPVIRQNSSLCNLIFSYVHTPPQNIANKSQILFAITIQVVYSKVNVHAYFLHINKFIYEKLWKT